MTDSRDRFEITKDRAAYAPGEDDSYDETFQYQPHPDYPMVTLSHRGIDRAWARLDSFIGVQLPREALYQIVAAYKSIEDDRDGRD